jgi:phosphonate transport system substrate-binding protein
VATKKGQFVTYEFVVNKRSPRIDDKSRVRIKEREKDYLAWDDKLTLEFVPSKDADVIIAGTANLPELVKAEMANLGYDIDEVDITVGTSYDATGEAMSAGSIDLGWLPGGTYALYSDDVDVILTATRNGLSNDSENPADWNGEANATQQNGPQVTYYRALIYATPSEYGKKLRLAGEE